MPRSTSLPLLFKENIICVKTQGKHKHLLSWSIQDKDAATYELHIIINFYQLASEIGSKKHEPHAQMKVCVFWKYFGWRQRGCNDAKLKAKENLEFLFRSLLLCSVDYLRLFIFNYIFFGLLADKIRFLVCCTLREKILFVRTRLMDNLYGFKHKQFSFQY